MGEMGRVREKNTSGGGGLLDLATDLATDLDAEETPRCTTATLCVSMCVRQQLRRKQTVMNTVNTWWGAGGRAGACAGVVCAGGLCVGVTCVRGDMCERKRWVHFFVFPSNTHFLHITQPVLAICRGKISFLSVGNDFSLN